MSDSCGDVIFFVVHTDLEFTRLTDKIGIGQHVFDVVGRRVGSRPNTDRLIRFIRYDSRILQRGPSQLQQDPLLRADQLGVARRLAKKSSVEMVSFFDDSTSRHVVGIVRVAWIECRIQLFGAENRNRLATVDEVVPVFIQITRTRHASRHTYDRVLTGVAVF